MDEQQGWQSSEVLAWSEGDGPGRPPAASRWLIGGVGLALAVTLTGILSTDALCPDHRAWVQTLASVAIFSAVVAIVQVLRSQPSAIVFALVSSVIGVAIGMIDAIHDPGRGMLISLGFAVAGVGSVIVAFRMQQLARWGADLSTAHLAPASDATPDAHAPASSVAAASVEVAAADAVAEDAAPVTDPVLPAIAVDPQADLSHR